MDAYHSETCLRGHSNVRETLLFMGHYYYITKHTCLQLGDTSHIWTFITNDPLYLYRGMELYHRHHISTDRMPSQPSKLNEGNEIAGGESVPYTPRSRHRSRLSPPRIRFLSDAGDVMSQLMLWGTHRALKMFPYWYKSNRKCLQPVRHGGVTW